VGHRSGVLRQGLSSAEADGARAASGSPAPSNRGFVARMLTVTLVPRHHDDNTIDVLEFASDPPFPNPAPPSSPADGYSRPLLRPAGMGGGGGGGA